MTVVTEGGVEKREEKKITGGEERRGEMGREERRGEMGREERGEEKIAVAAEGRARLDHRAIFASTRSFLAAGEEGQ